MIGFIYLPKAVARVARERFNGADPDILPTGAWSEVARAAWAAARYFEKPGDPPTPERQAEKALLVGFVRGEIPTSYARPSDAPAPIPARRWAGTDAADAFVTGKLEWVDSISATAGPAGPSHPIFAGGSVVLLAADLDHWLRGDGAPKPPGLPSALAWMEANAAGRKFAGAIDDCREATGCTDAIARAAWKAQPAATRGSRGKRKP